MRSSFHKAWPFHYFLYKFKFFYAEGKLYRSSSPNFIVHFKMYKPQILPRVNILNPNMSLNHQNNKIKIYTPSNIVCIKMTSGRSAILFYFNKTSLTPFAFKLIWFTKCVENSMPLTSKLCKAWQILQK